ncbi:MAG: hypothetical protein K6G27_06705 [Lachnospiraceae bacterium]|nr:hypothetical protein [Lachnospiraceae bacterium]
MKAQNIRISKEEEFVNRIRNLYEQVIGSGTHDTGYREKLKHELLKEQKENGSFSAIDNLHIDSDIRVCYAYEPTYYATAALMFIENMDPSGMTDTEKTALRKGLSFAEGRHLAGHGFSATSQRLKALRIYKDAGLYDWISRVGDTAPSFSEMIRKIIEKYRSALQTGATVSDWNVDFREEFEKEVRDYEEALVPYVWYACYGSNMSNERFMKYIQKCSDTSAPMESRPFQFPYTLYFAGESAAWGRRKGVAFLDEHTPGICPGKIYKVKRGQFGQIQMMEGIKYSKRLFMGMVDGVPVYSFTAQQLRTDKHAPGAGYLLTIIDGLREAWPEMSMLTAMSYLIRHDALSNDEREVLLFIRASKHSVSLQKISESCTIAVTRTKDAVKKLVNLGLICQDRRSIQAGHNVSSPDALFYTCPEMRELISQIRFGVI